jgi:hypothetical protein
MTEALEPVFAELRQRMIGACAGIDVATDLPGNLVLKTRWIEPGRKEPAWFGGVQLKKSYVSCHLMPVYALAELRARIPPELHKRMHGKSCFNFKTIEPALFDAFARLAAECAAAYASSVTARPH